MKNRRSLPVALIAVLAIGVSNAIAEDAFKSLGQGVEYRHDVRAAGPLSIHVLRIDRQQKWDVETGLGQGTIYGLEPLPGIVRRVASLLKKPAVAAINGDFFVLKPGPYQGDPRGLQIAQGELVSRPMGSSFWVTAKGELKIGPVESKLQVIWSDGKATPIGLNEARPDNEATLYTPTLGLRPNETPKEPPTTRTKGGKELILECGNALPIQAGRKYLARVAEVRDGGSSPLQPDKMILSIGPKLMFPKAKVGDVLQLVMETKPNLEGVKTALGTGRVLVTGGTLPDLGPKTQPRHPRSMIGWNDKYLYFIVVDGRQLSSIGMTYPELAALLKEYGCAEAVELDGGGSSTIWAMNKILNSPSDGRPRAVANGLILFRNERTAP